MAKRRKILLLGVGPLPCYRSRTLYGFGIRTWQFLLPMLKAGHEVVLVTFEFGRGQDPRPSIEYSAPPELWGNVTHIPLAEPNGRNRFQHVGALMRLINEHEPKAIVTAGSTIASGLAAALPTDLPTWIDLFGDLLAEAQAKAVFAGDEQLDLFHRLYLPILRRGDRFSSVADSQRYATYGQLGVVGRLTGRGTGEPLVHTVPCAMDGDSMPVRGKRLLRGHRLSRRDVALLCTGGFNTWADVETLFHGVDGAMDRDRFIHLVVTGGAISGHHQAGFDRFQKLAERSPNRDRYHFLGWLPNEDVPSSYAECDLGLNVDLDIAESMLGSRNRFLSWMQAGLPFVTSVTTEISRTLATRGLCYGVPPGDAERLTQTLVEAASDPLGRGRMALAARDFVYRVWSFEETTRPLLAWLENPAMARDRRERFDRGADCTPLEGRLAGFIGDPVVRAGEGVPPPKSLETSFPVRERPSSRSLPPLGGGDPLWRRAARALRDRWFRS